MKTGNLVFCVSLLTLFGAGCEVPTDGKSFMVQWNGLMAMIMGTPQVMPSPQASAPVEEEFSSAAAKNAKANAEILHEILQVVYDREPKDRADFGNWADTLNQGASFEGVYNGLTHSTDYRKLEVIHGGSSVEALKVFSEELAVLELELPHPTEFDVSASPLPDANDTDPSNSGSNSGANSGRTPPDKTTDMDLARQAPAPGGSSGPSPKEIQALADQYAKQFVGISIFTLKRVLGEEVLRVIGTKDSYREKLALWYSKWVLRILQRNVDFGIALRNKPDEAFHFKWALGVPEDRLKWEVLNRLHRVMNDANKHKQ